MIQSRAIVKGIPGDAARRKGLRRMLAPLLWLSVTFGVGVGLILGSVLLPWWVGVLILGLAFVGFLSYYQRQPSLTYGYFKGARGEEMVAGELAQLPSEWTIFNGILLPNGKDIDHIAIGPQGIFVIETKHWKGSVTIANGQVLAEGRVIQNSPIVQLRRAMTQVANVIEAPIESLNGILCFVGCQFADGRVQADEVQVCSHLGLLDTLTEGPVILDAATLSRCVARLGTLTLTEGI